MFFSQSIVSNVLGQHGGENGVVSNFNAEFPEGLEPDGPGTRMTRIFETDADFSMLSQAALRLTALPLLGEPVRELAGSIRDQLHEFIHANIRRPAAFGFQAQAHEAPSVAHILKACNEASEKLEHIFSDRAEGDIVSIQIRSAAHCVQSGLEGFLVGMTRDGGAEGVGEAELGGVLQQCIELKGFLATNMQELDALNAQYRAAMQAQVENLQAGGRPGSARRLG